MTLALSRDKSFYRKLFTLALPIAGQNLIIFALNMLDTIMLGSMGERELAAAGLANQPFFVFTLFLFGISSGSSILVSQYYGKEDKQSVSKIMSYALLVSFILSAVFMGVILAFPKQTMQIYSNDPAVVKLGAGFLRIIAPSYLLTAISTTYLSILRATEDVRLPLKINTLALVINGVLNYIFIFGKLGFPAMGVNGSALATLIARIIECSIAIYLMYSHREKIAIKVRYFIKWDKLLAKDFSRYVAPVICNESFWGLGVSVYSIILGRMGTSVVAAYNVAQVFEKFASVAMMGVANAAVIIIGQQLGAGREKKAEEASTTLLAVSVGIGIVCGLILFVINPFIFNMYNISDESVRCARQILFVIMGASIFKAFNCTAIVGVIRAGGDTTCALLLDLSGMWLIGLPLGFLFWKLGLPAYSVYIGFMVDEVYKCVVGWLRVRSRKWLKNITRDFIT